MAYKWGQSRWREGNSRREAVGCAADFRAEKEKTGKLTEAEVWFCSIRRDSLNAASEKAHLRVLKNCSLRIKGKQIEVLKKKWIGYGGNPAVSPPWLPKWSRNRRHSSLSQHSQKVYLSPPQKHQEIARAKLYSYRETEAQRDVFKWQ